jgi:hypothetical protein
MKMGRVDREEVKQAWDEAQFLAGTYGLKIVAYGTHPTCINLMTMRIDPKEKEK